MIKQDKKPSIAVIVPSYYPGEIIKHVLTTIDSGLKQYFSDYENLLIVVDSSDEKTQDDISDCIKDLKTKVITRFFKERVTKGLAIFRGLEIARKNSPIVTIMLDSDLRSIEPIWIYKMAMPIIENQIDFVAPNYIRDKYDGLITNHIVYPLVSLFFKTDLRQPIGGDFAMSNRLIEFYKEEKYIIPEVYRFGIDIWMSISALANGFSIAQVYLGVKDHAATIKDPVYPERSAGKMFQEVVTTMFQLIFCYQDFWKNSKSNAITNLFEALNVLPRPVAADFENTWKTFIRLYPECKKTYTRVLSSENFEKIDRMFFDGTRISFCDWVKVVLDYLKAFDGEKDVAERGALVNSLLSLYFARFASFIEETANLTNKEVENKIRSDNKLVAKTVREFVKNY